jgi:hypothetical protein
VLANEKTVLPLIFAKELQTAGIRLPATRAKTYTPDELRLASDNVGVAVGPRVSSRPRIEPVRTSPCSIW